MSTISVSTTSTTAYKVTADTTGTLAIQTGATPTTAVTIDASQNVGVGVVPSAWYNSGNLQVGSYAALYTNSSLGAVELTSNTYRSASSTWNYVAANHASRYQQYDGTHRWYTAASGSVGGAVSWSESMRIDASGNLLVGTTSAWSSSVHLQVKAASSAAAASFETLTASAADLIYMRNPNGVVGVITTNGSSTSYVTSSDYRLKENIAPMTGALEKVASLKPCTYTWKEDGSAGQGFIAHELQSVVPECVTGAKDALNQDGTPKYQGIDTSFLVATLTAAIQELKAELDAVKAQLENK